MNMAQHGFTKGRSCLTNLLESLEKWTDCIDEGSGVDIIYLDFSKAFDTVPHERLIGKLLDAGLDERVTRWIRSFLVGRKMRVSVDGKFSEWTSVPSGVPQGSVLGPILFLIFVSDLPSCVKESLIMFADDTKLWTKIGSVRDSTKLQDDLDSVVEWTQRWKLQLNYDKCKVLHLRQKHQTTYTMGDGVNKVNLQSVAEEKDLGVIITEDLKWSRQSCESAKKANRILGLIRRQFTHLDEQSFLVLYKSFVRPRLEYCIQAWSPNLKKDIEVLEAVQRRATKLVKNLRRKPYNARLESLKLTSLERRRTRGDLIEVHKILTGREGINPSTFFDRANTGYNLRGHSLKLYVDRYRTNARKFSFSNRVVPIWNNLSEETISAPSTNSFKNRLDKIKMGTPESW